MKELGMAIMGTFAIALFFGFKIYPNMEYSGYSAEGSRSCIGECYEEYVRINGTPSEIERKKNELASQDEFSSIRSLWAGCAACHGQNGEGMAVFPALAGKTQDYIVERLYQYKNKEQVGGMSSTMWAQAGMLTDEQINTLGKFIEVEL